jgi:hypothetical protein
MLRSLSGHLIRLRTLQAALGACLLLCAAPPVAGAQAAPPDKEVPPRPALPERPLPEPPLPPTPVQPGDRASPVIKPPPGIDPGMAKPAPVPSTDNTPIIKPPPNAENPSIPK